MYAREIEAHFERAFDVGGVTTACEYLADAGLIGKASTPLRLTKRSTIEVEELAFFYLDSPRPGAERRLSSHLCLVGSSLALPLARQGRHDKTDILLRVCHTVGRF